MGLIAIILGGAIVLGILFNLFTGGANDRVKVNEPTAPTTPAPAPSIPNPPASGKAVQLRGPANIATETGSRKTPLAFSGMTAPVSSTSQPS